MTSWSSACPWLTSMSLKECRAAIVTSTRRLSQCRECQPQMEKRECPATLFWRLILGQMGPQAVISVPSLEGTLGRSLSFGSVGYRDANTPSRREAAGGDVDVGAWVMGTGGRGTEGPNLASNSTAGLSGLLQGWPHP